MLLNIYYHIIFIFWFLISLLPLRVLYVFSDILYFPLYYCIRYRRSIVRNNLTSSFPDKSEAEIIKIEKEFYSFFCDYIMETIKLFSISRNQIKRRMKFENLEQLEETFQAGRSCSVYLGHYCNWEWISTLPASMSKNGICAQIYHPLESRVFDRLFLYMRGRFGGHSIPMDDSFRTVLDWKKRGVLNVMGYISDQVPGYNNIHYWTDFLHHDTPVFTGAERISRLADTAIFYADITRPKRGYYVCRFVKMTDDPGKTPKFSITEQYFRLLEETIQRSPQYWLWSHKRWKRTREVFNNLYSEEERNKRLSRL